MVMKLLGFFIIVATAFFVIFYTTGSKDRKNIENMQNMQTEFTKYGETVKDIISHRGEAEDWELNANIEFVLLDKIEKSGLPSFTVHERRVYAIGGMIREVNNGGFSQFFYNSSGDLAPDLIPALEALKAVETKRIAERAIKIFSAPLPMEREQRIEHLKQITNNFELDPWDECDNAFYNLSEPLEKMTIDYIELNINDFSS